MNKIALSLVVVVIVAVVVFLSRSGHNNEAALHSEPGQPGSAVIKPSSSNVTDAVPGTAQNVKSGSAMATGEIVSANPGAADRAALTDLPDARSLPQPDIAPAQTQGFSASNESTGVVQSGGDLYLSETARVAGFGKSLSMNEVEGLYAFLRSPVDANPDLDPVEVNSIKNDVMDKLLVQAVLPKNLGEVLVDLYSNRSNDELLRNYAVQHFELFLEQKVVRGDFDPKSPDVVAVRNAFLSAVEEKHNSVAGVALLGMERATAHDPLLNRDLVAAKALHYASDPGADRGTRIAAVQVCGVMKVPDAKITLRTLINDSSSIPLQLAAIHALGEAGDESDVDRLNELARSGSRFVRAAAGKAASIRERAAVRPVVSTGRD